MHVYLIGQPGPVGGACTEAWHTLRLWRRMGIAVTCIPTWRCDDAWASRLADAGAWMEAKTWNTFRLPAGSIAVSFCNQVFVKLVEAGRLDDCQTVYVPCMTQWTDAEQRLHIAGRRFSRYVFQSEFQATRLMPLLRGADVDAADCARIHGYVETDEFPFQPLARKFEAGPLTIGRISRADPRKFHADTWGIYRRIRDASQLAFPESFKGRILGWSRHVERKLGRPPPAWAHARAPGEETAMDFYRSLHLLVHAGGDADENWPRYCLEAMAAGVPIVTDRRGGIPEMLCDPVTARLCETPEDFVRAAADLARDDHRRLALAKAARWAVEEFYANPARTGPQWVKLFEELQ